MEFETTGRSGATCVRRVRMGRKSRGKKIFTLFFFIPLLRTPLRSCCAAGTTKNDIGNQRTGEKVIFRGCLENITRPGPRGKSQRENGRDETFKTRQQRTKASLKIRYGSIFAIYRIQLF